MATMALLKRKSGARLGVGVAVLAVMLAAGLPQPVAAQQDVKCRKCVDTVDTAKKAINASRLKPGAVTTDRLRDNAVTGVKIRASAISGADLANGAVGARELAADAVTGAAIQDGGIEGANLADGAVDAAKLATGAVTGAAIQDGAVAGSDLLDGAVDAAKLATGAVTSAAITDGSVTAAKLAPGTVTVGPDDIFARTLVVRPFGDGSNPAANGLELLDALTFLGSVSPSPGAANPWLVSLEAGLYDVGSTQVALLPYVDLEGAGEATTRIRGGDTFSPIVLGADHSEIRFLTVEHTGTTAVGPIVALQSGLAGSKVSYVTVIAEIAVDGSVNGVRLFGNTVASKITVRAVKTGGFGNVTAVSMQDTAVLRDSIMTAEVRSGITSTVSTGVAATGQPELVNVKAVARSTSSGNQKRALFFRSLNTDVTIRNSVLIAEGTANAAALSRDTPGLAKVAFTQLVGDVPPTSVTCFNAYDDSLVLLNAACQ